MVQFEYFLFTLNSWEHCVPYSQPQCCYLENIYSFKLNKVYYSTWTSQNIFNHFNRAVCVKFNVHHCSSVSCCISTKCSIWTKLFKGNIVFKLNELYIQNEVIFCSRKHSQLCEYGTQCCVMFNLNNLDYSEGPEIFRRCFLEVRAGFWISRSVLSSM